MLITLFNLTGSLMRLQRLGEPQTTVVKLTLMSVLAASHGIGYPMGTLPRAHAFVTTG